MNKIKFRLFVFCFFVVLTTGGVLLAEIMRTW